MKRICLFLLVFALLLGTVCPTIAEQSSSEGWDRIVKMQNEALSSTQTHDGKVDEENMVEINKIRIDGTDYNVKDSDARESIEQLSEEIEGLKGGGTTPDDIPSEETFEPSIDGCVKVSTGEISSVSGTKRTDYLPLKNVVHIEAVYKLSNVAYGLAFFDSNKNLMPEVSVIGANGNTNNQINMDAPTGAAYVILSDYRGTVVGGSYITLYYDTSDTSGNPLNGKTINVLGDSITSTNYTRPNWWEIIAGKTGAEFNNHGVSSTSIAVRADRTDSFVERAANLEVSADALIVMGGTNDNNIPRGAWDSEDTSTFFGALNNLLLTLCENFAGKPIIFCTPIQTAGGYTSNAANPGTALMGKTDSDALSMQLRAEAIKQKCAQYGVHCLDLYNGSGINGIDANRVYFRKDDTLHPSEIGQKRLANLIYKELLTFFEIN